MDLTPLYLSAKLALTSTLLLLVLAVPLSYCLVYRRFRGLFLLESLTSLPLVLPPTVLGFFLLIGLGPDSIIGRYWQNIFGTPLVFTFAGIVAASMIHTLPYAIQPLKTAFQKIDQHLVETAYVLGTSRFGTFRRVILPNAKGGLLAAAILAFAHIMGEFGVVLMVGGSIPGQTKVAAIAIFEQVETLQYRSAWLLSLTLLAMSYGVLLLFNYLNRTK